MGHESRPPAQAASSREATGQSAGLQPAGILLAQLAQELLLAWKFPPGWRISPGDAYTPVDPATRWRQTAARSRLTLQTPQPAALPWWDPPMMRPCVPCGWILGTLPVAMWLVLLYDSVHLFSACGVQHCVVNMPDLRQSLIPSPRWRFWVTCPQS